MSIAIGLLMTTVIGFVLAWIARGYRARIAEASASALFQGLQQQHERASHELLEFRSKYFELLGNRVEDSNARASAEAIAQQAPELTARLDRSNELIAAQQARIAALETDLTNGRALLQEERDLLEKARAALTDTSKALSADALISNNQAFIDLAKSALATFQEGARGDLEARQKAVDQMIQPIRESLCKVDTKLGEIETQCVSSYSALNGRSKAWSRPTYPCFEMKPRNSSRHFASRRFAAGMGRSS